MANINELVSQFVGAFNDHDLDAIDRMTHPDCVLEAPGGQRFKGRHEVRQWNQSWFTGFPDARITVRSVLVSGNTAVTENVFEGTHKGVLATPMGDVPATGRGLRGPYVEIDTFDDAGLVTSAHLYYDVADIMTQLGLMPAPAAAQA